jgi:hypothetical protein
VLPDYPELKAEAHAALMKWFKKRIDHYVGPGLSDIQSYHIPEGRSTAFVREDGEYDETKMKSLGAEFELKQSEVPTASLAFIQNKLESIARSMGEQQARMVFETLETVTEKTGNVVRSKGGAMTVDDFFEVFDKMEIDFDRNGRPSMPRMICGEGAARQMEEIDREIRGSPKIQRRFEDMMIRKRRHWLAREAARKLVG